MANYTLDLTGQQVNNALNEVHNNTVLKKTAQTFTDSEKSQARTNIGAASVADLNALANNTVSLSAQNLSTTQQRQVQTNLGFDILDSDSTHFNYTKAIVGGHLCLTFASR